MKSIKAKFIAFGSGISIVALADAIEARSATAILCFVAGGFGRVRGSAAQIVGQQILIVVVIIFFHCFIVISPYCFSAIPFTMVIESFAGWYLKAADSNYSSKATS